jgi:peptide/nickel transport system permease protein
VLTYALRRFLISIPIIILATFLIFGAISLSGDPLQDLRQQPNITQEQIDRVRELRGLDEPFPVQYWRWIQQIPTNGFGEYMLSPRPIWPDLQRVLLNTLQLVLPAEIIAFIIAVALGTDLCQTPVQRVRLHDHDAELLRLLHASVLVRPAPAGHGGPDLLHHRGADLPDREPLVGHPGTGLAFWLDRVHHLILPIASLAIFSVASYSRYMRASMLEVIHSDYVRTARAKGVPERRITTKHSMRNALIPTITVAALSFGTVVSGAIVIETVFGLDGMGRYFIAVPQPPRPVPDHGLAVHHRGGDRGLQPDRRPDVRLPRPEDPL